MIATRALLFAAIAVGASATGLWWAHERHDGLDVEVRLAAVVLGGDERDDRVVREELDFDPEALGEEALVRRIDAPEGGEVLLREGESAHVLVAPDDGDGLLLNIEPDAGPTVELTYVLLDAGDSLDLGELNAPAEVAVTTAGESNESNEPNEPNEVQLSLRPHETLRIPEQEQDEPPWTTVGLGVGLVALAAWLIVLRARRRPEVTADEFDDLPSSHSPAVVGWLLRHGRVTLADLAATVVDLTARGYIVPFRPDGALVLGQGRPPTDLVPHEQLVIDWLFADWVRQADLGAQRAAISADPERWSSLWTGFVERVEAQGAADELIERDVASPAVLTAAAVGLGLLLAGVIGTAHGHPGWLAPTLVGALVLPSATAFARRTPEGEALAARWEAFGDRLRSGEGLTPHALAYAMTLGEDDTARVPDADHGPWPAQLVHDEVERHVTGWREAYLTATSVRGEPSERVRALLSLGALRRRKGLDVAAEP